MSIMLFVLNFELILNRFATRMKAYKDGPIECI